MPPNNFPFRSLEKLEKNIEGTRFLYEERVILMKTPGLLNQNNKWMTYEVISELTLLH